MNPKQAIETKGIPRIPFIFVAIPKYFFTTGWSKNPKVATFLVWSFSRCKSHEQTIVHDQREIRLAPFSFIFGRRRCSEETGLTEDEIRTITKKFKKEGLLKTLPNRTPKRFTIYSWATERFLESDTHQIPQQAPKAPPSEPHNIEGRDQEKKEKILPTEESELLALTLYQTIQGYSPKTRKPNLMNWAKTFDLLLSKDGRTVAEIRKIIAWLPNSEFWRKVVLSPEKLRKHFDRLWLEVESARPDQNTTSNHQQDARSLPKERKLTFNSSN